MDYVHNNITNFFEELLTDIDCQNITKAYIISIFGKYKNTQCDLSKDSITILYSQAKIKHDFYIYQKIADWLFFTNVLAPTHLKFASKDYYDTVARLSYYSCYKIVNKQLKFYEEMSDNFSNLENQVKNKLKFNIQI